MWTFSPKREANKAWPESPKPQAHLIPSDRHVSTREEAVLTATRQLSWKPPRPHVIRGSSVQAVSPSLTSVQPPSHAVSRPVPRSHQSPSFTKHGETGHASAEEDAHNPTRRPKLLHAPAACTICSPLAQQFCRASLSATRGLHGKQQQISTCHVSHFKQKNEPFFPLPKTRLVHVFSLFCTINRSQNHNWKRRIEQRKIQRLEREF